MLLYLPQALSTNFAGILAVRWFQGMSSSVGNSMVGGTIADLFRADDRGRAMNIFSLVIFFGQVRAPSPPPPPPPVLVPVPVPVPKQLPQRGRSPVSQLTLRASAGCYSGGLQ
jgi:hypothetical protein